MTKFSKLYEEFYTGFGRAITGYTEVFKNPTGREVKTMAKQNAMSNDIRILGDPDGTIYAFAANITHYTASQQVPDDADIHMTYYKDDDDNEWYVWANVNKKKGLSKKLEKQVMKSFPETKQILYQGEH